MMERYLEQNELVTTTMCLLDKNNKYLNDKELALLQSFINVLETFEGAMTDISSEKITSLSKVIPMVRGIQACLKSIAVKDRHVMCELGQQLQIQMQRRFATVEVLFNLAAATLLDH